MYGYAVQLHRLLHSNENDLMTAMYYEINQIFFLAMAVAKGPGPGTEPTSRQ